MPIIHRYIGKYSSEGIGIYPNFNNELISKFRKQCKVDDDEVVIYTYDLNCFTTGSTGAAIKDIAKGFLLGGTLGLASLITNDNQYIFALTSKYIYYKPNAETVDSFYCSWDVIDEIETQGSTIHITIKDGRVFRVRDINNGLTGIHPTLPIDSIRNMLIEIWRVTQGIDDLEENFFNELCDKYDDIVERKPEETDEKYHSRIKEYCSYLETEFATMPESVRPFVLKMQAYLNCKVGLDKKAIANVSQYKELFGEDEEMNFIYGLSAEYDGTYKEYKEVYKHLFNRDISNFIFHTKEDVDEVLRIAKDKLSKNFLNYDYNDRRFLVIDSSMSYLDSENFIVLPKDNLPKGIQFPLGHPQERELYVCHPYNHSLYIPYESSEFELFKDKMDELRVVLQAMGAVSIKISDVKDSDEHNNDKNHIVVKGSVNAKINKANGEFDQKSESDEYAKLRQEYTIKSTLEPQRMPYIPDGLVWYPHQADWQRLFELRKGGLKSDCIRISTEQETKISKQKRLDLKADFQALISKVNVGVNTDTDSKFETKALSVWKLDVEFASLEELRERENAANNVDQPALTATIADPIPAAELTDEEMKYMEEVKFCLEDDDQIDAKEHRLLERFRAKYSISEERAAELESMLTGSAKEVLSAEEQEYCETVAEYAADGELSETDLRLLARLASSLDIVPEREKELQTKATTKTHSRTL